MNERDPLKTSLTDEQIAALLDGRLDAAERAELLANLSISDEDFRVFTETAAALREIEEAGQRTEWETPAPSVGGLPVDGPPSPAPATPAADITPPSLRSRGRWRRPSARLLSLAAMLAVAALAVTLWQPDARSAWDADGGVASHLSGSHSGLPEQWMERQPWERTQSAGFPLRASARATRVGALHLDLVLAVQAGDTAAAQRLVGELTVLLEEVPVPGSPVNAYHEVGHAVASRENAMKALEDAGNRAVRFVGADAMKAGAWIEAARVAAERHDEAFFRDRRVRAALERAGMRIQDPINFSRIGQEAQKLLHTRGG